MLISTPIYDLIVSLAATAGFQSAYLLSEVANSCIYRPTIGQSLHMASTLLLWLAIIIMLGAIVLLIFWNRIQAYRTAAKMSEDIGPCALCQEKRAGLKLHQSAITGLIFIYTTKSFSNYVCPPHARIIRNQFQLHTPRQAWWT